MQVASAALTGSSAHGLLPGQTAVQVEHGLESAGSFPWLAEQARGKRQAQMACVFPAAYMAKALGGEMQLPCWLAFRPGILGPAMPP